MGAEQRRDVTVKRPQAGPNSAGATLHGKQTALHSQVTALQPRTSHPGRDAAPLYAPRPLVWARTGPAPAVEPQTATLPTSGQQAFGARAHSTNRQDEFSDALKTKASQGDGFRLGR